MKKKSSPAPACRQVVSRALREAIVDSGLSATALAAESGVARRAIDRFLGEERDIRVDSLDRLADVLGLKLVETGRPRGRSRSARAEPPRDPRKPGAARGDDGKMELVDATPGEDGP